MILLECLGCRIGFYSILDLIHRVVFWRLLLNSKPTQEHGKQYFSANHKLYLLQISLRLPVRVDNTRSIDNQIFRGKEVLRVEENILPGTVGSLQNEGQASVILGFNLKGTPPMTRKTLSSIDIFLLSIPFHACSYICKSNLVARRCFFLVLLGQQVSISLLSVTLAARFVRDKLQYLST